MMMTRRDAVAAFAVFAEMIASRTDVGAQTPAPAAAPRPPVFVQDLPNVSLDGWEVTVSHVDYPPGRVGTAHHHAGFVLAYVLEGSIYTKISGQGERKTYNVGQMFYEQPGATHEESGNASQTAAGEAAGDDLCPEGRDAHNPGARRRMTARHPGRRDFLKTITAAGAAMWTADAVSTGAAPVTTRRRRSRSACARWSSGARRPDAR